MITALDIILAATRERFARQLDELEGIIEFHREMISSHACMALRGMVKKARTAWERDDLDGVADLRHRILDRLQIAVEA